MMETDDFADVLALLLIFIEGKTTETKRLALIKQARRLAQEAQKDDTGR